MKKLLDSSNDSGQIRTMFVKVRVKFWTNSSWSFLSKALGPIGSNLIFMFQVKEYFNFWWVIQIYLNPSSANPTKWPNTLKQFVSKLPTNCLSVFSHFVNLALKELTFKRLCFWNGTGICPWKPLGLNQAKTGN